MIGRGHDNTTGADGAAARVRGADWREAALCRQTDPELFFPVAERGPNTARQVAAAKAVCADCPVATACLEWALDALPVGIAGGATSAERRRMRATRGDRRPAVTPAPGAGRAETAACGRAALAGGEPVASVARRLAVTRRTVERWAATTCALAAASSARGVAAAAGGSR